MLTKPWVGQLGKKTLVFDATVQLPHCPHVFLWNSETGEMEKFIASISRGQIRRHSNAVKAAAAIVSAVLKLA